MGAGFSGSVEMANYLPAAGLAVSSAGGANGTRQALCATWRAKWMTSTARNGIRTHWDAVRSSACFGLVRRNSTRIRNAPAPREHFQNARR